VDDRFYEKHEYHALSSDKISLCLKSTATLAIHTVGLLMVGRAVARAAMVRKSSLYIILFLHSTPTLTNSTSPMMTTMAHQRMNMVLILQTVPIKL
jgi:hypothetical protein